MTQIRLNHFSLTLTESLIQDLTISFDRGWTGISGPNGCGKTTLARYICAALSGTDSPALPGERSGEISGPASISYMGQIPEYSAEELFGLYGMADNRDRRLMALLEIEEDWPYRFEELSWGEKRRLQLACALLIRPEVLILDEPENHLDLHGRELIIRTLREIEGIGIIIGHSRDIMNALCGSTLFLFQRRWHYYPHPLGRALEIYEGEEAALREEKGRLHREIGRQTRSLHDYRGHAEKASRALSKKGLSRHDSDSRSMIDLARISGADKASSRKVSVQKGRIEASRRKLEEISTDGIRKTGLTIREDNVRKQVLFCLEPGRHEGYPGFTLSLPELKIGREDRILLTGENGSGKTALLRLLHGRLADRVPTVMIPQEFNAEERSALLRDLNGRNDRGEVLAYFSRLGGDPGQLMDEKACSPGELKKLALAAAFLEGTALIILDEPANHLDIFSVRILEEALSAFQGALLMVSHEREFCREIITSFWKMDGGRLSTDPDRNSPKK
jgi:ATPase subunit of ABC transporter with duplicated ATPase domains